MRHWRQTYIGNLKKKKMYTKKRWKESKDKLMGVDESKEKEFKIVVIQKKDVIFA